MPCNTQKLLPGAYRLVYYEGWSFVINFRLKVQMLFSFFIFSTYTGCLCTGFTVASPKAVCRSSINMDPTYRDLKAMPEMTHGEHFAEDLTEGKGEGI